MLDHASNADPIATKPAPERANHLGCDCNSRQGWIVATTHPQAEVWANHNLCRRGYRTYLPLYAARCRDPVIHTLSRNVIRPLFPGYLFVHHTHASSWRPIYETPGVRGVLRNGPEIQWCPESVVEALQAGEDARRLPTTGESLWSPGAACTLAYGPCHGADAVLLRVMGAKARVALVMLGGLREVVVDLDCLAPRE